MGSFTPPSIAAARFRAMIGAFAAAAVAWVADYLNQRAIVQVVLVNLLAFVVFLGCLTPSLIWIRNQRQIKKLARNNDYLICPSCHYVLDKTLDAPKCPECGNVYIASKLQSDWMGYCG